MRFEGILATTTFALFLAAGCGDNVEGNRPPTGDDASLTTPEDTPITADLPVTDTTGELDVTLTAPANGTATVDGAQLTYTPAADFHGTDEFVVRASDGEFEVEVTVTVTVTPVNDAPTGRADTFAAVEDTASALATSAVLANDTDVDGDDLTVTAVGGATNGAVALAGDTITFTPTAEFNGDATFTYTVSDGAADADVVVTLTVGGANDAPVAVDDAASGTEDTVVTIAAATLLANDTDLDGQTLFIAGVGNPDSGTVVLDGATITFTPNVNVNGTLGFDYTVSDGAATDTAHVTLTIAAVDDAPVAVDDVATTAEDTEVDLDAADLVANDLDVDGDALTVTAVSGAVNGAVELDGTTVTFTPAADFTGTAGFDYTVSDGTLTDTGHVTVTVGGASDAPVAVDDVATTDEDTALALAAATLLANDTDADGDTLTVTAVSGAVNGAVALVGATITFTPAADFHGTAGFDYTVSDGALTDTGHVTVTVAPVDDAPVAVDDATPTDEDTAAVIAAATLLANDLDVDGDTLTITAVSGATNGAVALVGTTITFTPGTDFVGTAGFDYTVSDGALTDTGHVTVVVGGANDAPVAVDDATATAEDTAAVIAAATLTANDTDVDADPLTVTAVSGATNGAVSLVGTTITFTPAADFTGTAGFDYTVSDGVFSDVGHVTVTVTGVNDAPVAVDDAATTAEDTAAVIAAATLLADDTDVDGDTLTVTAVSGAVNGAVALAGTTITFTPAADFTGAASFEYTVSDGTLTDTGQVTVTVTAVADGPVAVDDATTTAEDAAAVIAAATLTANDTDADGDALTVTAVSGATNGAVSLVGATITFTPDANFHGTAGFDYTVSDGALTDTGHVTVTVTPVNDAPVAGDDVAIAAQDTPAGYTAALLLANDLDVDGDTLTVTAVSGATNGTVGLAGSTITFTPDTGFVGVAGFDYTVSDGTLTDTGHVTVTVTDANDAPVAVDDTAATDEDSAAVIAAATLTANDTDADLDVLTVTSVQNPVNGTVGLAGGVITFTPSADFHGAASFEYTVSDGLATDVGLVAVTVSSVDDLPVAVDDVGFTDEDLGIFVDVLVNDTGLGDGGLVLEIETPPSNGNASAGATNVLYMPAANFNGQDSFTYRITDADGDVDTATVTINLNAVDDPVVAVDDAFGTDEDTDLVVAAAALTANDSSVDGPVTVTSVGNTVNGTVDLSGGTVTFTPNPNFHGAASFEYVASDGDSTDVGVVTVAVASVDDLPVAVDDAGFTDEDLGIFVDVLVNDSGLGDGDLVLTLETPPASGTAIPGATNFLYLPAADVNGAVTFTYRLTDGDGDFSIATVTVNLNPLNDAPVATAGSQTTSEDTPVVITLAASDVDLDALTFAIATPPAHGTLGAITQLTPTTASVTYTPAVDYFGDDAFTFTANDGTVSSAPATVALTVTSVVECGDGVIEDAETCDDDNVADGDGCSAACAEETGWDCVGAPSACTEICGDGVAVGDEACDDDNAVETDGCTSLCVAGPVCDVVEYPTGDAFATDPATGHCYVSFAAEFTTYGDAYAACLGLDGHLVTITDAEENALVGGIATAPQWIGATDIAGTDTDDIFAWATDELWSFRVFATGEPDDDAGFGGNGECVIMVNGAGEWADANCDFDGFVSGRLCEIPASPCGNGIREPFEACEDGNTVDFDGCSSACVVEPPGRLLITEIDYDQPGAGNDTQEFVEFTNLGGQNVDLTLYSFVLINGSGSDLEYNWPTHTGRILLSEALDASGFSDTTLAPGQRLVISSTNVTPDASALRIRAGTENLIQNGETSFTASAGDAVGILEIATGNLVDALSYEGNVTAGTITGVGARDFTEGSGAGLNLFSAPAPNEMTNANSAGSLVRVFSGGVWSDTNNPNTDWTTAATPTPGT